MDEELFALKWNNHQSTFLRIIKNLRCKDLYADATLACNGKFFSVHRLVLSTCSDYFGDIFHQTSCRNPVIVLKDIDCKNLEYLLDYMYIGEINVRQNELASLVSVAECLKIKGLAVPDESDNQAGPSPSIRDMNNVNDKKSGRKMLKSSFSNTTEENHLFIETSRELVKEEDVFENLINKHLSDEAIQQSNIKCEPADSLLLGSDICSTDSVSNVNALSVDAPDSQNEQDLYRERFVDECIKGISSYPGTSYSQLEAHRNDWDSNHLGTMNAIFSSQLINSESHSDLPLLLSSEHQMISSKAAFGLKRLKKRVSQIKKNHSSFLNKTCFACPHCSYSCNDKSNFKRHVQIHTGEKPYHCPFCKYNCIHSSNLKTHIRNKHTDDLKDHSQSLRTCLSGKGRLGLENNVSNLLASSLLSTVQAP